MNNSTDPVVSAPFAIRDDRGMRKFENQPHVLLTQSGESYPFKSEIITSRGAHYLKAIMNCLKSIISQKVLRHYR